MALDGNTANSAAAARGGDPAAAAAHSVGSAAHGDNPAEAGRAAVAAQEGQDPCEAVAAAADGGAAAYHEVRRRGLRLDSGDTQNFQIVDSDNHRNSSSRIWNWSTRCFSNAPCAPIPPCTASKARTEAEAEAEPEPVPVVLLLAAAEADEALVSWKAALDVSRRNPYFLEFF